MSAATPAPPLGLEQLREAHARISEYINLTPVLTSKTLDARAGARLLWRIPPERCRRRRGPLCWRG